MTPSTSCYRLTLAGHLSQTATQLIDARFGAAPSIRCVGADSTVDLVADQPALRSLLTLLWDLGHELVAIDPIWPPGLRAGTSLSNPVTGQSVTFLALAPELLVMETSYRAGGPLAPEHYHPAQTEHFVALEGAVRVVVDGQERRLNRGEDLTLPPGTPHQFGATADQACRMRWEVTPALRTAEFLGTVFGLAQDGHTNKAGKPTLWQSVQVGREFDTEFRLTRPPRWVQRVAFTVLGRGGRGAACASKSRLPYSREKGRRATWAGQSSSQLPGPAARPA